MAYRGNSKIDKKTRSGQSNDVHEEIVRLDEDTESDRYRERLNENPDSVAHDGQHRPALSEHQRAGNSEHHRGAGDGDDHECERNEREDVLDWDHTSSLSLAVLANSAAVAVTNWFGVSDERKGW